MHFSSRVLLLHDREGRLRVLAMDFRHCQILDPVGDAVQCKPSQNHLSALATSKAWSRVNAAREIVAAGGSEE
jgi:hypothetical protein